MDAKKLTLEQELAIIKELEQFDTPTITNVVATYPGSSTCLSLYHPWEVNWYTDDRLKLMFPELGRVCGFAVTCTYGLPDTTIKAGPTFGAVSYTHLDVYKRQRQTRTDNIQSLSPGNKRWAR